MTTLIAIVLSLFSFSTDEVNQLNQQKEEHFIHGKIFLDVRTYGGMRKEYTEDNAKPAYGIQLKVVCFKEDGPPIVVDTIRSDVNGRFSVKLSQGTYGFIGMKDKPNKELYLPKGYTEQPDSNNNRRNGFTSSSYWKTNKELPITIENKDITGLHITHMQTTSCNRCP